MIANLFSDFIKKVSVVFSMVEKGLSSFFWILKNETIDLREGGLWIWWISDKNLLINKILIDVKSAENGEERNNKGRSNSLP